mmetsp:Transcript_39992/g.104219  ORF Transcript_39992/g.104219 Transcript_39992/m.104219 type:complete len:338 (-) Transcript_39992:3-1016(-)
MGRGLLRGGGQARPAPPFGLFVEVLGPPRLRAPWRRLRLRRRAGQRQQGAREAVGRGGAAERADGRRGGGALQRERGRAGALQVRQEEEALELARHGAPRRAGVGRRPRHARAAPLREAPEELLGPAVPREVLRLGGAAEGGLGAEDAAHQAEVLLVDGPLRLPPLRLVQRAGRRRRLAVAAACWQRQRRGGADQRAGSPAPGLEPRPSAGGSDLLGLPEAHGDPLQAVDQLPVLAADLGPPLVVAELAGLLLGGPDLPASGLREARVHHLPGADHRCLVLSVMVGPLVQLVQLRRVGRLRGAPLHEEHAPPPRRCRMQSRRKLAGPGAGGCGAKMA